MGKLKKCKVCERGINVYPPIEQTGGGLLGTSFVPKMRSITLPSQLITEFNFRGGGSLYEYRYFKGTVAREVSLLNILKEMKIATTTDFHIVYRLP